MNSVCFQMLTFQCTAYDKETTLVYPEKLFNAFKQFHNLVLWDWQGNYDTICELKFSNSTYN